MLDLQRAILRNDLVSFIRQTFGTVVPNQTFHMNWHIDALAHVLERCLRREIKRLILLMPPRNLKSISVSVAFPAYVLGRDPGARIICASYAQELANKHARDCRSVMESKWYRWTFPNTRLSSARAAIHDFETTKRGGRLATSVGGTLTGRGGSIIIIDDPMKADEAASEAVRLAVIEWFKNTVLSRLDNKLNDVIIVVMQRVHEDDLAGILMQDPSWHVLELPAIAEADTVVPLTMGRIKLRREGDVLSPTHEPREVLEQMQRDIGSSAFAAQYQQHPAPLGGDIVKWEWFKTYDKVPARQTDDRIVQSWDIAQTINESADYSVCTTWLLRGGTSYLLHVLRKRLEYPELKKLLIAHAITNEATTVLIENKNAGLPLLQELKQVPGLYAIACDPEKDKVTRMYVETPQIECGDVVIPKEAPWLADFRAEVCAFPKGKHDDQVDSLSQYLNWVRGSLSRPVARLKTVGLERYGTYYTGGSFERFLRRG